MMIFHRHIPVISYHIDRIFFNSPRWKIPVTGITDIEFLHLLAIDKKFSISKFNLLALLGHHTFQKHDFAAGKPHCYHIMPLGIREEIWDPPAKIYTSIVIGRLHTDSPNIKRNAEMSEKKIRKKCNQRNSDQELRREGRKKELSNLSIEGHVVRL
jgi:hypothetical protein